MVIIIILFAKLLFDEIIIQVYIAIYVLIVQVENCELMINCDNIVNHWNINILLFIFFSFIKIYKNIKMVII